MIVSVSVLKEYDNLDLAIKKVNESNADFIHIDVMDGVFVNNTKFPYEYLRKKIKLCQKKVDMHLMVQKEELVKKYAELKPYYLTFHVEIIKDNILIKYLKNKGIKVGLAINPETDVSKLLPYINDVDLILIMSVNPGLGGQKFIYDVTNKIDYLKTVIKNDIVISIDGGINDETVKYCSKCDMVVSGSYITNSNNYDEKINGLRCDKNEKI